MAKKPILIEEGESSPVLIKMVRETPQHPDGPVEAEVHSDEVEIWKSYNWVVAE